MILIWIWQFKKMIQPLSASQFHTFICRIVWHHFPSYWYLWNTKPGKNWPIKAQHGPINRKIGFEAVYKYSFTKLFWCLVHNRRLFNFSLFSPSASRTSYYHESCMWKRIVVIYILNTGVKENYGYLYPEYTGLLFVVSEQDK